MTQKGGDSTWGLAFQIAAVYGVIGLLWILLSDKLVMAVTSSWYHRAALQSMKGGAFIMLSSLLIFFLVGVSLQGWSRTEAELDVALAQADRLHRILRHNLRNSCQIITGNAELLAEGTVNDEDERLQRIQKQSERLIALSQKSVILRDFLDTDTDQLIEQELVETIEREIEKARENYPEATITIDCPSRVHVSAHQYIGQAVQELIENAIVHNDSPSPEVSIAVQPDNEEVTVSVSDNGSGIPSVERFVLEQKTETMTKHSQGLGLWLVYLTIHYSNGTLTVTNPEGKGATVQFTISTA